MTLTLEMNLAVAVAGGLGAVCRFVIDYWAIGLTSRFPLGTFVVNILGAALLGVLTGLVLRYGVSAELQIVVGGGFLGAFTTFSTWMTDTISLAQRKRWLSAVLNILGTLLIGMAAAAVCIATVRL